MDGSGRRRRLLRVGGIVLSVLVCGYVAVLAVSVAVGSDVPITTWVLPDEPSESPTGKAPKQVSPSQDARKAQPDGGRQNPAPVQPAGTHPADEPSATSDDEEEPSTPVSPRPAATESDDPTAEPEPEAEPTVEPEPAPEPEETTDPVEEVPAGG
ncbi:hypothetical protein GCM10022221_05000 [Actinocorallia aurea]